MEGNYVYILECSDHTYYTGWTHNIDRRLKAHNSGRGAKYTRGRGPVTLCYFESLDSKESALKREYRIKRMTRSEKQALIDAFHNKMEGKEK